MTPTEDVFLHIARKLNLKNLEPDKYEKKDLGEDLINRNLFFFNVMRHIMHLDEVVSDYTESDCNPDAGKWGSWLEPQFEYFGDWLEFEKFGLYEISNKKVGMNYWDEEKGDTSEVDLTDEHYEILRYFAEVWRDHLNEEAKCYTGNAMRDCGHRYSDFI